MGQGEIKPFWTLKPLYKGGWKRLSAFLKRRAKVPGRVSKLTTEYYHCTVPPLKTNYRGPANRSRYYCQRDFRKQAGKGEQ